MFHTQILNIAFRINKLYNLPQNLQNEPKSFGQNTSYSQKGIQCNKMLEENNLFLFWLSRALAKERKHYGTFPWRRRYIILSPGLVHLVPAKIWHWQILFTVCSRHQKPLTRCIGALSALLSLGSVVYLHFTCAAKVILIAFVGCRKSRLFVGLNVFMKAPIDMS